MAFTSAGVLWMLVVYLAFQVVRPGVCATAILLFLAIGFVGRRWSWLAALLASALSASIWMYVDLHGGRVAAFVWQWHWAFLFIAGLIDCGVAALVLRVIRFMRQRETSVAGSKQ